jgi:PAS domain S-box-containing protein
MSGRQRALSEAAKIQAEEALRASEERYRILVESQSEMLCRFRRDGRILFVNGAYARARGTTAAALTGSNFWSFVPEAERPAVEAMLDRLTPESPEIRIENLFHTVDGERWILWTNRGLIFDAKGRLLEAQSSGIDITRRKEMEQALKDSDRRKDEFLATLAHELRNPLAPIGNALEILKQAGDDPQILKTAREAIERQMFHLVRLVDDLLDVSRITRDKLELRKTRADLNSAIRHAIETCLPLAEAKGQLVTVDLPEEPIHLDADPVRLAQIFNNLLNNACKFTGRGGRIRLAARSENAEVVVSVSDDGIGMPPDRLNSIFEMFSQVPASSPTVGLGIGLTLVKRLVELHGGSVRACSEGPGHGSEFIVRLPVALTLQQPYEERLEGVGDEAPSPRRILVVDDNRDSADSLALLLKLQGHEVRAVYDGLSAVHTAERFAPDVVLLDRGLPILDGIEACRRIRGNTWGRSLVIVALTGWGQEEDRRRSREAGFDEHLVKPVSNEALLKLLKQFPPLRDRPIEQGASAEARV